MQYPINAIFQTLQGEGVYVGVPSIFIRLQGCPVGCQWCDTKYTWNKLSHKEISWESIPLKISNNNSWGLADTTEILDTITNLGWTAKHVVITGGEPCLYDLRPLSIALQATGLTCQIETSGTHAILCSMETWVTVSPKIKKNKNHSLLHQALKRADEIKHPVGRQRDIDALVNCIKTITDEKKRIILLQPINHITSAIQLCIKTCIQKNWRLSIQTHKYINIP
ncbi:7-carboxy-7-deazaguanine synthase QueE [Candidatus Erwinia haradaeae]|uniref:7-carboxy-7-deazaguanine synthase n=1 Tax=Candidatus Erwinia haradaeae TaxID=1922217 RepID=A0A451DIG9_9GAMM|nr:7-carboxy-7-deazaguanine synthase QueE [Candidatus Erwinia haradaeae]VFP86480.1 7-carboxy-7-deazaguanine synthase [Candidatus Erwinia haradaeae]